MTLLLTGTGVSPGIAMGKTHVLRRGRPDVLEYAIPRQHLADEVARFRRALATVTRQLRDIQRHIPADAPRDVAGFIDTHLLMLGDRLLAEDTITLIRERQCNAEWALKIQQDNIVSVFDAMEDAYLRTRRDDVAYVIERLQRTLLEDEGSVPPRRNLRGRVVVADDLSPADMVLLQEAQIAGFVTDAGGPLSHTAIMARGLGIPAVVGTHTASSLLHDGEDLIIDGDTGMVLAGADDRLSRHYRQRQKAARQHVRALRALVDTPACTRDGQAIQLMANVELAEDLRALRHAGADGVGLYRTEYLFLNRTAPPGEEEQLRHYRRLVNASQGRPVTIRTVDLGADKLDVDGAGQALNPALGLRAIRRSLKEPEVFLVQLRAILRASHQGPVRIMLPMLTSPAELDQALELLERAKHQLRRERRRFDAEIPVGGMIETPAAALLSEHFARQLDFLSIGTNDLIQYTLAIDRLDESVTYLYDPLHPAVLRLITLTIEAGQRVATPVAMCGEMAGDLRLTRLLLGMGLTEFSVRPNMLGEIKRRILDTDLEALRPLMHLLDTAHTEPAVAELVTRLNAL
ncbi:MAG: phosphoenolpyruvate--protein phosphotransferase [Gammaproteobacteria bacterium]|nr:phosphoenolpyruvate--protein phosphotransferase [Gammaproteobacteria bacterium]MDX5374762.1 phosphoenolpyruvate--protein phosphotransferase [Gammaproteobacteria bacterium]